VRVISKSLDALVWRDSDLPYSTLVEKMQQGAALCWTLAGVIVYRNLSLAQQWGVAREQEFASRLQNMEDGGAQRIGSRAARQRRSDARSSQHEHCHRSGSVS
jgi:hypothetical protein